MTAKVRHMNAAQRLLRAQQRLTRNRIARALVRPFIPVTPRDDMQRFGSAYGGWWTPTSMIGPDSIVYSAGIGGDASFDLALMERFGCRVWGFDPTPYSIDWVREQVWPDLWNFEPIGIWTYAGTLSFEAPAGRSGGSSSITRPGNGAAAFAAAVEPLTNIMERYGHDRIDLLKMDIEGAEGPVLDALLATHVRPKIICVEYDQPEAPWRLAARVRRLLAAGYQVNKVEAWNYTLTLNHLLDD